MRVFDPTPLVQASEPGGWAMGTATAPNSGRLASTSLPVDKMHLPAGGRFELLLRAAEICAAAGHLPDHTAAESGATTFALTAERSLSPLPHKPLRLLSAKMRIIGEHIPGRDGRRIHTFTELFDAIRSGQFQPSPPQWRLLTSGLKDLIAQTCLPEEARITLARGFRLAKNAARPSPFLEAARRAEVPDGHEPHGELRNALKQLVRYPARYSAEISQRAFHSAFAVLADSQRPPEEVGALVQLLLTVHNCRKIDFAGADERVLFDRALQFIPGSSPPAGPQIAFRQLKVLHELARAIALERLEPRAVDAQQIFARSGALLHSRNIRPEIAHDQLSFYFLALRAAHFPYNPDQCRLYLSHAPAILANAELPVERRASTAILVLDAAEARGHVFSTAEKSALSDSFVKLLAEPAVSNELCNGLAVHIMQVLGAQGVRQAGPSDAARVGGEAVVPLRSASGSLTPERMLQGPGTP